MTGTAVPAQAARCQPAVQQTLTEHERHRLARELHDGAIQEVLAAGLAIDLCLADLPEGSPVQASLEHARRLTATAVRRLRSSLQNLREGATAPDEELPDMLRRLKAQHPVRRLDVCVEVTGTPVPLAAMVSRSMFQMARECVFNAAVHGQARHAVIRLSYGCAVIALCVADDGSGNPKMLRKIIRGEVPGTGLGYHMGLSDIAARAEEMGWSLRADRSDLGGIAIRVSLPTPGPGLPTRRDPWMRSGSPSSTTTRSSGRACGPCSTGNQICGWSARRRPPGRLRRCSTGPVPGWCSWI